MPNVTQLFSGRVLILFLPASVGCFLTCRRKAEGPAWSERRQSGAQSSSLPSFWSPRVLLCMGFEHGTPLCVIYNRCILTSSSSVLCPPSLLSAAQHNTDLGQVFCRRHSGTQPCLKGKPPGARSNTSPEGSQTCLASSKFQ